MCMSVRVFVVKVKLSMLLCITVKSLGFHGNNLGETEREGVAIEVVFSSESLSNNKGNNSS